MSYPVGPQSYPRPAVPAQFHRAPPPQSSTAHVVIAWILTVLTAGYLLPWAIAATRNKTNVLAIAMINLFLGWSVVGWIAALVMACLNDAPQQTVVVNTFPSLPPQPYQAQPYDAFRQQPPQYPLNPYQPHQYPAFPAHPGTYPPALNPPAPQEHPTPYGYSHESYPRQAPPQ